MTAQDMASRLEQLADEARAHRSQCTDETTSAAWAAAEAQALGALAQLQQAVALTRKSGPGARALVLP